MIKTHELNGNLKELPEVSTMDLVNYLILKHKFYTGEQLKAYKSLQAYKFVEAGFCQALKFKKIEGYYVVVGEVSFCDKFYLIKSISWLIFFAEITTSLIYHSTKLRGAIKLIFNTITLFLRSTYFNIFFR